MGSKNAQHKQYEGREISEAVGYARHTKFSKAFKAYYGETPLTYRHNRKMESAASAAKNKEEQSETDY